MAYTHMGTPTGHTHTGKHSYGHNHRDTYTRAYTTWDFWTINSLPPQPSTVQYNLGPQQVTNSLGYNEVLLGRPCLDSHWATTRFSLGALASAKKGIRPRSLQLTQKEEQGRTTSSQPTIYLSPRTIVTSPHIVLTNQNKDILYSNCYILLHSSCPLSPSIVRVVVTSSSYTG